VIAVDAAIRPIWPTRAATWAVGVQLVIVLKQSRDAAEVDHGAK